MTISSVTSFVGAAAMQGAMSPTRQISPASNDPMASVRQEIREKGLAAWAHDQQMEALKEKLRAQVLDSRDLSEEDLAAMPAEQRASVENEIQKMIAEKLEEAMKTAIEEAAKTGKTKAILVDISV